MRSEQNAQNEQNEQNEQNRNTTDPEPLRHQYHHHYHYHHFIPSHNEGSQSQHSPLNMLLEYLNTHQPQSQSQSYRSTRPPSPPSPPLPRPPRRPPRSPPPPIPSFMHQSTTTSESMDGIASVFDPHNLRIMFFDVMNDEARNMRTQPSRPTTIRDIQAHTDVLYVSETHGDDDESSDDLSMCPICHVGYERDNIARRIRHCGHMFHIQCLENWLNSHNTCPVCRHVLQQQQQ